MKHRFKVKVYPGDTDIYGVVWHGSYIKWLEAGRIELLEKIGIKFHELDKMGILMPVVEFDTRYKRFTRVYEMLSIETSIEQFNKTDVVFYQEIKNIETNKLILSARVKGVTTNREGKLFKVIPDYLQEKYFACCK